MGCDTAVFSWAAESNVQKERAAARDNRRNRSEFLFARLLRGISGASYGVDSRKALFNRGHRGESGVRLGLVPIGDGEKIIGAMICMAMFNRRSQRFGERNRRVQMKAIDG